MHLAAGGTHCASSNPGCGQITDAIIVPSLRQSICRVASQVADKNKLAHTINSKWVIELGTDPGRVSEHGPLNGPDGPGCNGGATATLVALVTTFLVTKAGSDWSDDWWLCQWVVVVVESSSGTNLCKEFCLRFLEQMRLAAAGLNLGL